MKVRVTPITYICILLIFLQMASCTTQRKIGFEQQTTYLSTPEALYPPADVIIATHNAWTRAYYPTRIKVFREQPLQLHDIVFLGNSITEQGGDWGERLTKDHVKNRGIAGDVTDGVLARLGEVVYVKPPAVFIEIGINDLFNPTLTPERTANNIIRIADTIKKYSPRTRIFVQTIFPTKNDFLVFKISKTNDLLRNYKKKRPYTLIETHPLFADEADLMKKDLTKDGVHLNEKGYAVWVNYLRKFF
jgi:lysophospholipase L1-like esterase